MAARADSENDSDRLFELSGNLSPAEAAAGRDSLLDALARAKADDVTFRIEVDEDPTPCALQLLIACERSAKQLGLELLFSERAKKALDGINLN